MASPRPVSDTFSSNRAPRSVSVVRRRQPWTVVLECDGQAAILALARRRDAATSPFESVSPKDPHQSCFCRRAGSASRPLTRSSRPSRASYSSFALATGAAALSSCLRAEHELLATRRIRSGRAGRACQGGQAQEDEPSLDRAVDALRLDRDHLVMGGLR